MNEKIIEALNKRYATKIFDPKRKISEKDLLTILEAIRLCPTSYGLQLMKVVVVENNNVQEELFSVSYNQVQIKEASHVLVLCREKEVKASHISDYISAIANTREISEEMLEGYKSMMENSILKMPVTQQEIWMEKQVYIALGVLSTACAVLGVDSCPMEGFVASEYDRILGLEEKNLSVVLVVPIGYRSELDKTASAKKVRRAADDFIVKV